MGIINMDFRASAFDFPVINPCEWIKISGTNGDIIILAFDDTTEEYAQIDLKLPTNLDLAGSVIFEAEGFAAAADGNEIQLAANDSAKNSGENWDAAYLQNKSGDNVTDSDQDELDYITWSVSVADLGWAANDGVRFMLSRPAIDGGVPVNGDYYVRHLRIRMPTT